MTPLEFTLAVFAISVGGGVLGSLLGFGGGMIIIPALVLLFDVDIRFAIGASIVSVAATSSGAAVSYLREQVANLRLATFLQVPASVGALIGASLAGLVPTQWLHILFGLAVAAAAVMMSLKPTGGRPDHVPPDRLADRLLLHGSYHEEATGLEVRYGATRVTAGIGFTWVAGVVAGLLGLGGGGLTAVAMSVGMGLPLKVSTATSSLIIGVTAVSGAAVYLARGDINPFIAAPVALGVTLGAVVGSRLLHRIPSRSLRLLFVGFMLWIGVQMLFRGLG